MKKTHKTAAMIFAAVLAGALFAIPVAAGAFVAVGFVTWLALKAETTFVDVTAVLIVALFGMRKALDWTMQAFTAAHPRIDTWLKEKIAQQRAAKADRAPVWLDRPPCEGRYNIEWPSGTAVSRVTIKRRLPHDGLFAILSTRMVPIDELVEAGARFDGPLSAN